MTFGLGASLVDRPGSPDVSETAMADPFLVLTQPTKRWLRAMYDLMYKADRLFVYPSPLPYLGSLPSKKYRFSHSL